MTAASQPEYIESKDGSFRGMLFYALIDKNRSSKTIDGVAIVYNSKEVVILRFVGEGEAGVKETWKTYYLPIVRSLRAK